MEKIKGTIVVNTERCKGCQLCIIACPKNFIALAQKKVNAHGYPYVEARCPTSSSVAFRAPLCAPTVVLLFTKKVE